MLTAKEKRVQRIKLVQHLAKTQQNKVITIKVAKGIIKECKGDRDLIDLYFFPVVLKKGDTYDFSYKDNEGDLFSSDSFNSESEARKEIARLKKLYDGDFTVVESWKYNSNNEYKGSWY